MVIHEMTAQECRDMLNIPCGGSLPPFRLTDMHSGLPLHSAHPD